MNKTQLVDVVAKATELKKKEADAAVDAVLEAIAAALADGDKVQIVGFGTFEVKERAAREGHNPFNGEKIMIPAPRNTAIKTPKKIIAGETNGSVSICMF